MQLTKWPSQKKGRRKGRYRPHYHNPSADHTKPLRLDLTPDQDLTWSGVDLAAGALPSTLPPMRCTCGNGQVCEADRQWSLQNMRERKYQQLTLPEERLHLARRKLGYARRAEAHYDKVLADPDVAGNMGKRALVRNERIKARRRARHWEREVQKAEALLETTQGQGDDQAS